MNACENHAKNRIAMDFFVCLTLVRAAGRKIEMNIRYILHPIGIMALARLTSAIFSAIERHILLAVTSIISSYVRESDRDVFLRLIASQNLGDLRFAITDIQIAGSIETVGYNMTPICNTVEYQQITLIPPMECMFHKYGGLWCGPFDTENRIKNLRESKSIFRLCGRTVELELCTQKFEGTFDELWKAILSSGVSACFPPRPGMVRISLSIEEQIRLMVDECL